MEAERPAGRFAVAFVALAALVFVVAMLVAVRAGDAGETILGGGGAAFEAVVAVGGALAGAVAALLPLARLPLLALSLLWCVWWATRPAEKRGALPLLSALALGWLAQSFLLTGPTWFGVVVYAAAVASACVAVPLAAAREAPHPWRSAVLLAALLAVFSVVCLYRLEVLPALYVDEVAYLRAARMFAGQIEIGHMLGPGTREVYAYEQFAAQTVPIALQAAAIQWLPSDLITTRLVSMLAVGTALVIAVLALRPSLGVRSVTWMLVLSATAPLVVVYSRTGFYLGVTVLHCAVCFAALLWLVKRWNLPSAAVVGVLLGSSLYHYQLSWFVPVFAAIAFALTPELWRRERVVAITATLSLAGLLTLAPGLLLLEAGLDRVNAQTFGRVFWNSPDDEAATARERNFDFVLAVPPTAVPVEQVTALEETAKQRGLALRLEHSNRGAPMFWFSGKPVGVAALAESLRDRAPDWLVLEFDWVDPSPWHRLERMLGQLFYTPGWESWGRWLSGPVLNPLLAPLLVVGLVFGWRRRGDPAVRLLLVFVVAGATLPALAGGAIPRRTLLMLPFAYALMALPLVDLGRHAARAPGPLRVLAGAGALAFGLIALATGAQRGQQVWGHKDATVDASGTVLEFIKVLKTRPTDEVVLAPDHYRNFENLIDAGDASRSWPEWHLAEFGTTPLKVVRELSCGQPPPFTWITPDRPSYRAGLDFLAEYYEVENADQDPILVRRATAGRRVLCLMPDP